MRHHYAIGILLAALTFFGSAQLSAQNSAPRDWQKFLIPEGETVYDVVNHVTWLADANLAANKDFRFGLPLCDSSSTEPTEPCVNASGSMNYESATAWVAAMNNAHYLGHSNWQLPTTPMRILAVQNLGRWATASGSAAMGTRWASSTTQRWASRLPIPLFPSQPTWWGHSGTSNLASIGPLPPVMARPGALRSFHSPVGLRVALPGVISSMCCR